MIPEINEMMSSTIRDLARAMEPQLIGALEHRLHVAGYHPVARQLVDHYGSHLRTEMHR